VVTLHLADTLFVYVDAILTCADLVIGHHCRNPQLRQLPHRWPAQTLTKGLLRSSAVAQNSHTLSFQGSIQGDDSHRKIAIDYQCFTKSMSLPSHS
jgi:hypothetical protein